LAQVTRLILSILLLYPLTLKAGALPKKELFSYKIKWNGVLLVGKSSLSMKKKGDKLTFEIKAKTVAPVDTFFSVRDRFYASAPSDLSSFLFFEKRLQEGRYRRHDVIKYNPSTGELIYSKNGKIKNRDKIPPPIFDPFSILFAYRFHCSPKKICHIPVTDGRHKEMLEVLPLTQEKVKVPAGTFITTKVEPRWNKMKGIFKKKKKGHVYIWFSNDDLRIPIKVEADIFLGKVVGELTGYRIDGIN